jgi:hypothetical protein
VIGNAGVRSATGVGAGGGSLTFGGPGEGRSVCMSGSRGIGVSPSPPSKIAASHARKKRKTTRPARRIHRARCPLASSRIPCS